jgi:hypothetical protein
MFKTTKLKDYLGYDPKNVDDDAVGIEIEMESNHTAFPHAPKGWTSHEDHSLKAMYNREYVTKPIHIDLVRVQLKALKDKLDMYNVVIYPSIRAGVHVHINVLQLTLQQILNVSYTYLAMERVLMGFCGPNRVGNLFCLRASDAEYLLDRLYAAKQTEHFNLLHTDDLRYASLNMSALFKHGTLEFRAMRTDPELKDIAEWAEMLVSIKHYGSELKSPVDIAADISQLGPDQWVKRVLGDDLYERVKSPSLEDNVMKDLRNIQYLLHS